MEAQWGLQDGHWGRQMATWGPPNGKQEGHLVAGMVVLGVPTCPLDNP